MDNRNGNPLRKGERIIDSYCVQGSTNGTIGNTIGTNGNANGTIGSPNGTIGKPMVPMATNGTIGKITNGTIGRTPNRAYIAYTKV